MKSTKKKLSSLALAAAATLSLNLEAQIVLDLDNEVIKGGSTIKGYEGDVEVLAWGWSLSNDYEIVVGAGGGWRPG